MNFYHMKHTIDETELCRLEKKCLFNIATEENSFSIPVYIDVDRSPFVKFCIKDFWQADSLQSLLQTIKDQQISYDDFKVKYLDLEGTVAFEQRHVIEGQIGYEIIGAVRLSDPKITIGVTVIDGVWIIGEYLKNNAVWLENRNRPQGYCNSLPTRASRAILNIATGNQNELRIIDPCCGVGTVVLEGLSMGLNIIGSDINASIVRGARSNMRHFGYPVECVSVRNIHEITEYYDVAVIDLPYGILSIADRELQMGIIRSSIAICDTLAVIAIEELEQELIEAGLEIVHRCILLKGNFKRQLYICKTYKPA